MIKTMNELPLAGKRVFIRVDFNVAIDEKERVVDDTRIRAVLPTIQEALAQEAKVILASHLGRPKGNRDPHFSLLPVAAHLSKLLGKDVIFPEDCVGDAVKKLTSEMRDGDVILLENLRFHPEEEKNDPSFSEKLASLADIYVNDAFGTLHRSHASTVGMVKYFKEKGVGFLVKKEVDFLKRVLEKPERPLVAILGGSKVSDKLGVVEYLLSNVDTLIIGGAMAYTFLKASGVKVGKSLVDESKVHLAAKFLERAKLKGVPLLLPVDHRVATEMKPNIPSRVVQGDIPDDQMGLDIGPQTIKNFSQAIMDAKTLLWNGPMGVFEIPPFDQGTLSIANEISRSKAFSVVGGGDSASAVTAAGVANKMAHVSTGGGATLACLEGKALPGLKALDI
jgi:phosphoglycerate kinase